jgi:hypothetical protein
MENNKGQEKLGTNLKNKGIKNLNQFQNKIIRSKAKNIYPPKENAKTKIISNAYTKPKVVSSINNNINNKPIFNNINFNHNIINSNHKNNEEEKYIKQSDLILLKKLKEENLKLKKESENQDQILKELHNLFIHNYNKINLLKKKYSHYKRYLQKSLIEDDSDNLLKEKLEEEFALRAVEQQIMNEICPNPDSMSYEQLLQLEEEVGNVNKGLAKDKINKIPLKPFHKALFDDNNDCIICMEGFSEGEFVKQLMCGHIFHGDCIDHWLSQQKNCPFCKAECGNIF